MSLKASERVDVVNIGLMLLSCAVAFYIPFELFLFSYAILGPLHYLTEISWLHDRKYFTKERYDALILLAVGVLLTLKYFSKNLGLEFPENTDADLTYVAFLGSLIFVTVKNKFYRVAGIVLLIITSQLSHNFILFFTVFLPTLIHVYIFTGLFMLFGALKSKSRMGILSVVTLVLCPILLFTLFPQTAFHIPGTYSQNAMKPFKTVNINWLQNVSGYSKQNNYEDWYKIMFFSKDGILLMRFIAFAYTYHYLNWFSKTSIIHWHRVPKSRFAVVIAILAISIALYLYNYIVGLQWLFFLSFLHVLLELPLNFTSIIGIGKQLQEKVGKVALLKS
jgi:hypothetical protein